MIYPHIVNIEGSKSGLLTYVNQHLPQIPTTDSFLIKPDDSLDDAIREMEKLGILDERIIIRPSFKELLNGYDGEFDSPTMSATVSNDIIVKTIIGVMDCPANYTRRTGVTFENSKANAMVAPFQNTKYHGTLIEHPNIPDTYLVDIVSSNADACTDFVMRSFYICDTNGINKNKDYTPFDSVSATDEISYTINQAIFWTREISDLPEVDSDISLVLEFGITPDVLFEVKYFREKDYSQKRTGYNPLVIGNADKTYENVSVGSNRSDPHVIKDYMHCAQKYDRKNAIGAIVPHAKSFINHIGISFMRDIPLVAFYPGQLPKELEKADYVKIEKTGGFKVA